MMHLSLKSVIWDSASLLYKQENPPPRLWHQSYTGASTSRVKACTTNSHSVLAAQHCLLQPHHADAGRRRASHAAGPQRHCLCT